MGSTPRGLATGAILFCLLCSKTICELGCCCCELGDCCWLTGPDWPGPTVGGAIWDGWGPEGLGCDESVGPLGDIPGPMGPPGWPLIPPICDCMWGCWGGPWLCCIMRIFCIWWGSPIINGIEYKTSIKIGITNFVFSFSLNSYIMYCEHI